MQDAVACGFICICALSLRQQCSMNLFYFARAVLYHDVCCVQCIGHMSGHHFLCA
jgi:hypothetical protein